MQFQAKNPAYPEGSHEAKIKSHPCLVFVCMVSVFIVDGLVWLSYVRHILLNISPTNSDQRIICCVETVLISQCLYVWCPSSVFRMFIEISPEARLKTAGFTGTFQHSSWGWNILQNVFRFDASCCSC
jgi:hypothetical protein